MGYVIRHYVIEAKSSARTGEGRGRGVKLSSMSPAAAHRRVLLRLALGHLSVPPAGQRDVDGDLDCERNRDAIDAAPRESKEAL